MNNYYFRLFFATSFLILFSVCAAYAAKESGETVTSETSISTKSIEKENADNLRKWQGLPEEQKEELRKRYQRFKSTDPIQKRKILEKFQHYKNLSPEQKKHVRENWEKFKSEPLEQREKLRKKYKRWQSLSEEQKRSFHERHKRFREMPPEKQEKLMQKREKWQSLPSEKRQQLQREFKEKHQQPLKPRPFKRPANRFKET